MGGLHIKGKEEEHGVGTGKRKEGDVEREGREGMRVEEEVAEAAGRLAQGPAGLHSSR